MTGSLRHLGGDRWKLTVYAGHDHDRRKRQRTRTIRARTEREAKKLANGVADELIKAINADSERRETLAGVADQWIRQNEREWSPSTTVNYRRLVKRITDRFGTRRPADVRARDIDLWYLELRDKGTTPAGIGHIHSVLRSILTLAYTWDMVPGIATKKVKPPTVAKHEITLPTPAAINAVIDAADMEVSTAVHVMAATGARRGELVGLQWADIDGGAIWIARSLLDVKGHAGQVKTTKTKGKRRVPVGSDTLERLARWQVEHARRCEAVGIPVSPWMFTVFKPRRGEVQGGPHAPSWLSQRWAHLRTTEGITARLHDLRHWNASTLIAAGVPVIEVSKRLGHAKPSTTTDIYGQRVDDDGQAADVMQRALGPGST